ncbi:MAG: class I SAM-dependent methyltransferase [Comamonadaceae bacterium]|nr:MAG: class I SAM-dependent methyltransferase [Comamonadaceae bacterium]
MSPDAYTQMARVQSTHWWFVARREILRSQISALNLPPKADILEVGSGTGANLGLLLEFGQVTGLEMNAEAIELAKSHSAEVRMRVNLLQGTCPKDLPSVHQTFDLICLFDVLEHIPDDEQTLAALRLLLKPGGKIMLTVPAHQWMFGPHDVTLHHQRRYSRSTLQSVCESSQLVVEKISFFNMLLFPLALAGRCFDILARRNESSGSGVPAAPVNRLFKAVFASERHLLRKMPLPAGLSLLLVASNGADVSNQ